MTQRIHWKNLALKSLVVMGLWTIIILLISSITFLSSLQEGISMSIIEILFYEFLCISPWILLTPFIVRLARRYSFTKEILPSTILMHLSAMAAVFSLHTLIQSYVVSVQYDIAFTWSYLKLDFIGFIDMRVMLYAGILLAVYGIDYHKKIREAKLREPRLKADLNRAKFQALLNNIQPDFMLTTLDTIKERLDEDVDASEEILTEFSDLLRIMLNSQNKEELPVEEDLKSFHLYINILQKRTGQPLEKQVDIEEECYDALVPSFLILIPVIEKIIHAVCPGPGTIYNIGYKARLAKNRVRLQAFLKGENLPTINIRDLDNNTGIKEMIKRLQLKYGENIDFGIDSDESMLSVNLNIPYKRAALDKSRVQFSPNLYQD